MAKKKTGKSFNESAHPRAADGTFTTDSSGTKKGSGRAYGAAKPAKAVGRATGSNPTEKASLLSSARKGAKSRAALASQAVTTLPKPLRKPSLPMAGAAKSSKLKMVEMGGRAGRAAARVVKAVEHKDYKTLAGTAGRNAARVAHVAGVAGRRAVQDTIAMGYVGKALGEVAGAGLLGLAKKAGNAFSGKKRRR